MRIGTSLAQPQSPQALSVLRDELKMAVNDGFASAWMANIFGLDAITALAIVGRETCRIELGTAVVPTYPRHPSRSRSRRSPRRPRRAAASLLGIGLSHKIVIENMFGFSSTSPAVHMREYLAVLAAAAARRAGAVPGRDDTGAAQPVQCRGAARVPVLARGARAEDAAAHRPARRRHDHLDDRPEDARGTTSSRRIARRRRRRVGRRRASSRLPVCVTDDPRGAARRAARRFEIYGQLPSYRAMLDREGAAGPADVAIVGDEDEVASQIAALADLA